jgi:hypothetical protein
MEVLKMENKPEDIVLKVFLQRHGPKLSAAGEKNELAPYFRASVEEGFDKMGIENGKGLVHVSGSSVKRAEDTAMIDLEKISATEHRLPNEISQEKILTTPFQPIGEAGDEKYADDLKIFLELQAAIEPAAREKVESELPNLSTEEREAEVRDLVDRGVLSVLFNEEKRKARGLQTSYEELADNLAKRYEGFWAHAGFLASKREEEKKQPQDEPYIQIDVSHSFTIMSFLKKYLVFEDGTAAAEMTPDDFFAKTGGVIRESGFLEMDYELEGDKYVIKVKGEFLPPNNFSGQLKFSDQYEEKK